MNKLVKSTVVALALLVSTSINASAAPHTFYTDDDDDRPEACGPDEEFKYRNIGWEDKTAPIFGKVCKADQCVEGIWSTNITVPKEMCIGFDIATIIGSTF